jgi:hypothetical protein
MQTIQLKYDVISWITGLDDKKMIHQLHQWMEKQKSANISVEEVSSRRNRNLTKGFGLWADNAPFDETNYRNKIWQQERNAW